MLDGYNRDGDCRALNGEVVTDTESDNPAVYSDMKPHTKRFETAVQNTE